MKYIIVPAEQPLVNIMGTRMKDEHGQDANIDFAGFVLGRLSDPKFSEDMASVLIAVEIKRRMDEAAGHGRVTAAAGFVALEDEHYRRLRAVTEKPSAASAYHPAVAHCLVPFMKAICDAKDEPPRSEEGNEQ